MQLRVATRTLKARNMVFSQYLNETRQQSIKGKKHQRIFTSILKTRKKGRSRWKTSIKSNHFLIRRIHKHART
jgi:hypothetical protein